MLKRLLLLFTGFLFYFSALAGTFIVTSNADSGPGTLREAIALAAANGTAIQDIISFNLPADVASRTCNVLSVLPALSSNLIIDGTTQPGNAFGISDAKIILSYQLPAIPPGTITFDCFNTANARDIEIYGIYFRSYSTANDFSGVAVNCNNSTNIRVGAPGKGNIFTGWRTAIGQPEGFMQPYAGSDSIFVQSNIFGLLEDGNTTTYSIDNYHPYDACCIFAISFKTSSNIKIGGATAAEGNLINFSVCAVNLTAPANIPTGSFYIIQNNSLGCNASKTFCRTTPTPNYECIHADGINGLQIADNLIMGSDKICGIYLINCKEFSVKGNIINTDLNGNQTNSVMNEGIIVRGSKGIIGGTQPGEGNIIAYTNNLAGISVTNGPPITISGNSTYCNHDRGSIHVSGSDAVPPPFITILSATGNTISGKALPGSKVELFMDDDCALCEGKLYVTTVIADAGGNWTYNGNNTDRMVATATDVSGSTSEFSIAKINLSITPVVKPATCGLKNGAISNIQILSGTKWYWEDEAGNIAGTDTLLHNAAPGKYRLVVEVGSFYCSYKTNYIEINEVLLPAAVNPVIMASTCGTSNGAVSVTYNTADFNGKWLNAAMDSIGTGLLLDKVMPGDYYLILSVASDLTCNQRYGPFSITNQSGPSLVLGNMQTVPATCSKNNGTITGITASNVTGTVFIQWVDSLNKTVGNSYDLVNMFPGKYRLKFKDETSCDTIITSYYTISDNGLIEIDDANKLVIPSSCTGVTGSIKQIHVTGGEIYQWLNTNTNTIAGAAPDLLNTGPGNYQLQVSNHYGCSKTLPAIAIPQASFNSIVVTNSVSKDALCAQPNGMVKITSFNKDSSLYSFRWINSNNAQVTGTGTSINNLGAGNYELFAKDVNGCEEKIFSAPIAIHPAPTFDYQQLLHVDDNCNLHQGSISAIKINGLYGPTTYTWYDDMNNITGNTLNLQNAGKGTYVLKVTDGGTCTIQSAPFTISNNSVGLKAPVYDNLIIPRYADASIKIKNPANGTYTLSSDAAAVNILQQNSTGNFIVPKIMADTSFYVTLVSGACSSPAVKVPVKVVDKSYFAVPTGFTPNNDGKNDRLSVKVIGYISLEYFKIFDRFGAQVYETQKINDGWDGRLKGVLQNNGGYVWIARGKDINGNIVSDKGSFILIR